MSTTAPVPPAHERNLSSDQFNTSEPDHLSSTVDLPTDPLLDARSFIRTDPSATSGSNTNTTTIDHTPNKREPIREQKSANPATSNGAESVSPPETTPLRRPAATAVPSEPPNWLPPGWSVEDRVRTSGATAGAVDRYYYHIDSGHRFRSKKEVLYFLETGTKRKRRKENSDADMDSLGSSGSTKQNKSGTRGKTSALNFDYFNAPDDIEWVLTDPSEDSWSPFIGEDKVPESIQQEWAAAFTYVTTSNGGYTTF